MEIALGFFVAVGIAAAGRISGMDRDRALYPVMLIVIAMYYVLFSLMGGSSEIVAWDFVIASAFVVAAFVGFHATLWVVMFGLGAHGVFDWIHPLLLDHGGVPGWWPGFCLGVDITLAAALAWLILSERIDARAA